MVVSLGANLSGGDRSPNQNLLKAHSQLETLLGISLRLSSLWLTEPEDCPPGTPYFVNAVLTGWLPRSCQPLEILEILHSVEAAYGRVRGVTTNAPRTLDLDLVCLGSLISQDCRLRLPHPRAHLRSFVLRPLAELLPDLVLPGQTRSVSALIDQLPPSNDKKMQGAP
ncbi:MAG: hypothetical protein RLZZ385_1705 [Pseudomonadota bacterium]|jgi:2-amino-4-hydroxy-6-hydroxymethyldihydropteridine diphosphokinase